MVKFRALGQVLISIFFISLTLFILAPAVFASTDSYEQTLEKRDEKRLADLYRVNKGIKVIVKGAFDPKILCNYSPLPCYGNSVVDSNAADGTGWVKVNLTQFTNTLPVDPVNSPGGNGFHYSYCGDIPAGSLPGFELNTKLESLKYSPLMTTDGGDDSTLYEVGSNLTLMGVTSGCAY